MKVLKHTSIYLMLIFSMVVISCGDSENKTEKEEEKSIVGGELNLPIKSYFKIEKPTEILKIESAQIYGQIFESLVKYNTKTLEIEPSLAKEWTKSEDGLAYTFTIRDDVYFHDNACFENGIGRKVNIQDVVDMFYRLYENTPTNVGYYTFANTVKGGDDYYEGKVEEIEGIETEGDKITVHLEEPNNTFLAKLVTIMASVLPKESFETNDWLPVGTGSFIYDTKSNSEHVILTKNPKYWMKDENGIQLPYLDKLTFKYYENSNLEIDDFWDGKLAIIDNVPITKISEVLEDKISDFESNPPKYVLESIPQMSTSYIEFNMTSKVMKNIKVRQAINYAIDRKKIVEKTLKNQAYEEGKFGITPPLSKFYPGYDFNAIEKVSYHRNTEKAKQLLAEAGYPDGKGFPTISLQFKMDNDRYLIMSEVQNQLRSVLNINIDIEQVEFNQLIENRNYAKTDMYESVWVGDFPSPESFLVNFYGKTVPKDLSTPSLVNRSRYINKQFDEYFEKGYFAHSNEEANQYFLEAEKILMQDAPLIVLFYGEHLLLKQANIQNFYTNGMNYISFTEVYLQEPKKKEEKQTQK